MPQCKGEGADSAEAFSCDLKTAAAVVLALHLPHWNGLPVVIVYSQDVLETL